MTVNLTTTDEVTIIAEMANAHEGELSTAKKIVSSVADSADAVKFQVFTADELVLASHPDYEEFVELAMSEDEWQELIEHSRSQGVSVIADVFGTQSVGVMSSYGVELFKIHNADTSNLALIEDVAECASGVILSAGGSTWIELAEALDHIGDVPTLLMYGYQNYPTVIEDANLKRMQAIDDTIDTPVGYASHAPGDSNVAVELPRLATTAGASAVEVHVTLDRSEEGTDYFSSLEPDEFETMAQQTKAVERLLGDRTLSLPKTEQEY
jgi:N,N'-diacetyllegionaminate synthase